MERPAIHERPRPAPVTNATRPSNDPISLLLGPLVRGVGTTMPPGRGPG